MMNRILHERVFRVVFAITLTGISYLAFTPLNHAVAEQVTDKGNHVVAFLVLAGLLDGAFRPFTSRWLAKAMCLLGYGVLIECIQVFLPNREFSLLDVMADAVGILVYFVPAFLIVRLVKRAPGQ